MALKVIPRKNIPVRLPVNFTIILFLLLDRLHVPGWAWGVAIALMLVFWALIICMMVFEESTEIFDHEKSKFSTNR